MTDAILFNFFENSKFNFPEYQMLSNEIIRTRIIESLNSEIVWKMSSINDTQLNKTDLNTISYISRTSVGVDESKKCK